MMRVLLLLAALWLPAADVVAQPPSLAEVARAEAARRKQMADKGKVYTNEDLRPDPTTPRPPATTEPSEATEEAGAEPDAPAADAPAEETRDQAYWQGRIGAARGALQRSRMFAEALQSRINGLNADFVNRDDPIQRAQIAGERDKALAELARVNKEIEAQTKAIADIEDEARRAGVPPGWLRTP